MNEREIELLKVSEPKTLALALALLRYGEEEYGPSRDDYLRRKARSQRRREWSLKLVPVLLTIGLGVLIKACS
jgi:hypothetical protein